jgi:hypothetical protein
MARNKIVAGEGSMKWNHFSCFLLAFFLIMSSCVSNGNDRNGNALEGADSIPLDDTLDAQQDDSVDDSLDDFGDAAGDDADDDTSSDNSVDDTSSEDDSLDDTDDDTVFNVPEATDPSDTIGVFVAQTGSDANPGTMAEPVKSIARGIGIAFPDEKNVFVARGRYDESVIAQVSIYGGYEEEFWGRDIVNNKTEIVAPANEPGMEILDSARVPFVIIDGLYITGYGGESGSFSGLSAGVVIDGSNVLLRRNTLRSGECVDSFAGCTSCGLYMRDGSDVVIYENDILGGPAYGIANETDVVSAGIAMHFSASVFLANNRISSSLATSFTGYCKSVGVLNVSAGVLTIVNNVISAGPSLTSAAVYASGDILAVNNTVIIRPSLFSNGFFIENPFIGSPVDSVRLINNIIHAPQPVSGAAVNNAGGATAQLTIVGNDFWGPFAGIICHGTTCINDPALINACDWIRCEEAHDNFSADPLFEAGQEYRLSSVSPCIDTGVDPDPWLWVGVADRDIDGENRPFGSGWDVGWDEWTAGVY